MMKKSNKAKIVTFNEKELQKELLHSAKAVGVSAAVAEAISIKIAKKVGERLARRAAVTTEDLNRFIAEEAEKYSQDLAYVYQNRGKIM